MLGKQALHFATKSLIASAGSRKELRSPLWRLFHSAVKYFFDLFQSSRGHFASFPRKSSRSRTPRRGSTALQASSHYFHFSSLAPGVYTPPARLKQAANDGTPEKQMLVTAFESIKATRPRTHGYKVALFS